MGSSPALGTIFPIFVTPTTLLLTTALFHSRPQLNEAGSAFMDEDNPSGLVRYEAMLHSCRTSPVGDGYQLVPVCTHGGFIMLPHWNTRPLAP